MVNSGGTRGAGPAPVTRRAVLRWAGSAGMMAVGGAVLGCTPVGSGPGTVLEGVIGSVVVPSGFSVRVVATGNQQVPGTAYTYGIFPDGAATFVDHEVPGGWYLAVNHEVPGQGGVSSIRFAPDGTVTGARSILRNTSVNCAGGATPWGTWLSCEEHDLGRVWECDPTGATTARPLPGLGRFAHEAAAVADDDRVYLTEDRGDGAFYRFTPDVAGDLSSGLLEVALGTAPGPVTWEPVPRPSGGSVPTRHQVPGTMAFDGGEGIDTHGGVVWFTTKGDDRVWRYTLASQTVELHHQGGGSSVLSGVDNLLADPASGTLLVAEDGGDMQLVVIRADGSAEAIVEVTGQDISEVCGPCFSPDGTRLYFSSQRAQVGPLGLPLGATYEVTGPFDALLGRS